MFKRNYLIPPLVFIFLTLSSLFVWYELRKVVGERTEESFQRIADSLEIRLEDGLREYIDILYAGRGLFNASDVVSREGWRIFIVSQNLNQRLPAIQALEFIPRVPANQKDAFVASVRIDYPDFDIYPAGERDEYYVVNYIEPFEENEKAFGFDLKSEPSRKAALEQSRDSGLPVATAPITLVQEKGEQVGFLIFLPVYQKGLPLESIPERQTALAGFVLAVFRVDDLINSLLTSERDIEKLRVVIRDKDDPMVLFGHFDSDYDKEMKDLRSIPVGGRMWEIEFHALPEFFTQSTERFLPTLALVIGLLISLSLSSIVYLLLTNRERAVQLAEELTKDLQKFKLAVEYASDHIMITDIDGHILYVNKAAEKTTGYSIEEMIGQRPSLWGKKMGPEFYKKLWETIKVKKEVFTGQLINQRKDGEKYEVELHIAPVLDKENKVIFFVGIERDITKEKEIDRAKTEFVSLASHQLRTPLSTIKWYAEMLLSDDAGKLNKQQRDFINEIYVGNQRMVGLVSSLLNVSRIELGTFAIESEPVNFVEIAESVVGELLPEIKNKKLNLKKNYDANIPLINGDSKLVRIIFQNTLSNAVKYTPEKGQITLTVEKREPNIFISVADTGYGIPKGQQSRIFEKLFRADNVREKDTDGTGLGLYIVKAIVDEGGGKIWFESIENKGTTFYVTLPLAGMKKKEGTKGLS